MPTIPARRRKRSDIRTNEADNLSATDAGSLGGGQSGGGAYPNPHTGKTGTAEAEVARTRSEDGAYAPGYHGGGQAGAKGADKNGHTAASKGVGRSRGRVD